MKILRQALEPTTSQALEPTTLSIRPTLNVLRILSFLFFIFPSRPRFHRQQTLYPHSVSSSTPLCLSTHVRVSLPHCAPLTLCLCGSLIASLKPTLPLCLSHSASAYPSASASTSASKSTCAYACAAAHTRPRWTLEPEWLLNNASSSRVESGVVLSLVLSFCPVVFACCLPCCEPPTRIPSYPCLSLRPNGYRASARLASAFALTCVSRSRLPCAHARRLRCPSHFNTAVAVLFRSPNGAPRGTHRGAPNLGGGSG
jgi:hypothetical protein